MKVGSAFSGIGGIDLGLERAGMRTAWQIENDSYCQRVLAKHWPDVPRWGDIREVNPDDLPRVDLIAAGFPCQPVSVAGRGLAQEDERWLWPEAARLIRALRPRWVLLENVPGLLARGMGDVLGDLAASGYDAEWDCIPASAVGAPHQRDRVWVVAYPSSAGHRPKPGSLRGDALRRDGQAHGDQLGGRGAAPDAECVELRHQPGWRDGQDRPGAPVAGDDGQAWDVEDANGCAVESRWRGRRTPEASELADPQGQRRELRATEGERPRRPASGGPEVGDPESQRRWPGLRQSRTRQEPWRIDFAEPANAGWWRVEPDVGRVAHGIPARVDRLRSLGNAVVPQVVEHIGRLILAAEQERAA